MKACGVEGTNQGLVAFTSRSIHYICRFTFKEQDEVRYSTNYNRLFSTVNFCTAVKIDVFVFIESELSPNRSTSKVMWQSREIVCIISSLCL